MRKHIAWLVSILILTTGIGFTNTENIFASSDTIEHQLAKLDGVTKVTKLEMEKETGDLDEKFMLYFEQPLDWEHPEKGTFIQRVELGIRSNAEANALLTNGYNMNESLFAVDTDPEGLTGLLNANYIQVEHRFFGGSRPEGMRDDNSNFEYWYEYYNLKNSTADFHKIYTELSKVLGEDKWIAYGRSYRGIMTNAYAYYYPDDMDVYLPYCAPTSCGMDDERFYDNVYKTIGDDREDGAELRKLFTDFQVELMRNKEELMPIFIEALEKDGGTYTEFATPERVFDITVLEFAVQMWQRKENQTTELGEDAKTLFPRVMLKSEDTEEEKQAKLEEQITRYLQRSNHSTGPPILRFSLTTSVPAQSSGSTITTSTTSAGPCRRQVCRLRTCPSQRKWSRPYFKILCLRRRRKKYSNTAAIIMTLLQVI